MSTTDSTPAEAASGSPRPGASDPAVGWRRGGDLATAAGQPVDEVLGYLVTTPTGLSQAEVDRRLAAVGRNVLTSHRATAFGVLIRQLRNPLLLLLLGAASVSLFTGDPTDGLIIGVIVVLSVGLGFVNEYRAEAAVAALHASVHHHTTVWRDGRPTQLDVQDLVPGDVVDLHVGDVVPADLRLLRADELECDEALLTGEAAPAAKTTEPVPAGDSPVELPSCAFMGTVVHSGTGRGVVVTTGASTAFGGIAEELGQRPPETSFQAGLRGFSKMLVGVAGLLTVAILVVNVAASRPFIDALLFSLAIAIGITPQLLPAIVSVSLSAGSRSLARRRVLVKRLVAIEDLGNIDLLFTDKTGTLTEGAITFDRTLGPSGRPDRRPFLLGLLCNEATPTPDGPVGGNALDRALLAASIGTSIGTGSAHCSELGDSSELEGAERTAALPFDHERQLASVAVALADGRALLVTKGAPEAVLSRCSSQSAVAAETLNQLFSEGARVVAVGTRHLAGPTRSRLSAEDERDLDLAGFVTFVDRPRDDAHDSLVKLQALGVTVKVITGDNGTVARKVCQDVDVQVEGVVTGAELEEFDDDRLAAVLPHTTIFARVSPQQKSRIVKVARRDGTDVAFLGDGVNDAVALHAADVGISVDSATDVAKDAADVLLLEKDLGVLAEGIMEGRRTFANTLKYVLMATSSNFGNMFSAAGASLFLSFLPMLPSQVLLNNLLYDVGQLAIPTDRVDPEALARPSAWDISFVRRFMAIFGPISSLFDFTTFFVMLVVLHAGHAEFRSGWFVESLATQTLVVYVIRTRRVPFFRSRPSLPMAILPVVCAVIGAVLPFSPLAGILGFAALPLAFFLVLVGMIATYLVLAELAKRRFYAVQAHPREHVRTPAERQMRRLARSAHRFRHRHVGRHVGRRAVDTSPQPTEIDRIHERPV